ncbi:hypothetical protein SLS55_007426 [Diplodia seriata]|uniref:Uncharacterized protein n=1 Tax=Diplodia seriata TaxID=420778 RepID=A0ABR3CC91_9PEZI
MSNQSKPGRLETTGLRRHSETDISSPGSLRSPLTDGVPVSSPLSLRQESRTKEQASELQLRWNEGIAKYIGFSDGYDHVAVLIVKWHGDLDTLKCQEEVEELEDVFRNDFNYTTRTIELHTKSSPQLQLNKEMAQFVYDFDGPRTLLIVYYTGHSKYRPTARRASATEPGLLEFLA